MKRDPAANSGWFPVLKIVIELAALGLATWAMTVERNPGRVLTGGTTSPEPAPPAGT